MQYSNSRHLCRGSLPAACSQVVLVCEPNIKGLAIFDFTCGEPLVSLGSFTLPLDAILCLLCASSFVNDLVDEEFLLSISDDRGGWDECSLWKKVVVVFLKRLEFGCVENGEGMRRVGEVERDCGVLFVSSGDLVGAVESWHELSNTEVIL